MTPSPPTDQELLERLRAGDEAAFEVLFHAYYPGLLRFATAHLGDRGEAEDAVHDVFLRVWRERARLGGDRSLRVYLLASVRNRVIDLVRQRTARGRWMTPDAIDPGEEPRSAAIAQGSSLASDDVEAAELEAAIRTAIRGLPERCRTAFLLCREQELTYAQAAEVMGVSPATVKTQIARALASLRTSLEPFMSVVLAAAAGLRL